MLKFFAKRLNEAHKDESGFTLIELLVVVIIIGVLAAIAIPVFLAQRERAYAATLQSDVRNGAASATAYAAAPANNGSYTGMTAAILKSTYGWNLSPQVTGESVTVAASGNTYTLTATHPGAAATEDSCTFDSATGRITCS